MNPWLQGLLVSQAAVQVLEVGERGRLYAHAAAAAEAIGLPLLIVGKPNPWEYPCSDGVTIDLDPRVCEVCPAGGIAADVRAIPYPDNTFGAVFIPHVLEHMPSLEDARLAYSECWRVSAGYVFVAYPRRWNLYAIVKPDHYLWVRPDGPNLWVTERRGRHRTALIAPDGRILDGAHA